MARNIRRHVVADARSRLALTVVILAGSLLLSGCAASGASAAIEHATLINLLPTQSELAGSTHQSISVTSPPTDMSAAPQHKQGNSGGSKCATSTSRLDSQGFPSGAAETFENSRDSNENYDVGSLRYATVDAANQAIDRYRAFISDCSSGTFAVKALDVPGSGAVGFSYKASTIAIIQRGQVLVRIGARAAVDNSSRKSFFADVIKAAEDHLDNLH